MKMATCGWCNKPLSYRFDPSEQQCDRCSASYCSVACTEASKICRRCAQLNYVKLQSHMQQHITIAMQANRMLVMAMFSMYPHYRQGILSRGVPYSDDFRTCDTMYKQYTTSGIGPASIEPLYALISRMYDIGAHLP